jgi:hypothetical protein
VASRLLDLIENRKGFSIGVESAIHTPHPKLRFGADIERPSDSRLTLIDSIKVLNFRLPRPLVIILANEDPTHAYG